MITEREVLLRGWLADVLGMEIGALHPASADASFRRYWRIAYQDRTMIAVDAPPEHEDSARFVELATAFRRAGLNTPEVLAKDLERGFLLVSDLGTQTYLSRLDATTAGPLYAEAMQALVRLQAGMETAILPRYDEPFLRRELAIFDEWLLEGLLGLELSEPERRTLADVGDRLVENALVQPQVAVHRDFHSRNLMVLERDGPGVLDFQDAVLGPVTYDLASLLKDCYIAWPRARVASWALDFLGLAVQAEVLDACDEARFLEWLDLMGAQRHLKAAGIFARLAIRDGRRGYLADLPRTLRYLLEAGASHPELSGLGAIIERRILPRLPEIIA